MNLGGSDVVEDSEVEEDDEEEGDGGDEEDTEVPIQGLI